MPRLVRVPESIAGTVFPVFVDAAAGVEVDDRTVPAEHVEADRGVDITDDELSKLPY